MSVKEPSERPSSELSAQYQNEVQKLRKFDDQSLSVDKRLTLLVERLIVDAIQRQDEGLTKVGVSCLASSPHRMWPLVPSSRHVYPITAFLFTLGRLRYSVCLARRTPTGACDVCLPLPLGSCCPRTRRLLAACCHVPVRCSLQSCDLTCVLPAWLFRVGSHRKRSRRC